MNAPEGAAKPPRKKSPLEGDALGAKVTPAHRLTHTVCAPTAGAQGFLRP